MNMFFDKTLHFRSHNIGPLPKYIYSIKLAKLQFLSGSGRLQKRPDMQCYLWVVDGFLSVWDSQYQNGLKLGTQKWLSQMSIGQAFVNRHRSFCSQTDLCPPLEMFAQINGKSALPDCLESGREEKEHLQERGRFSKFTAHPNPLCMAPLIKRGH